MRWSRCSRFNGFAIRWRLVELRDGSKKPVVDTRMVRARDILDRAFRKKEVTSPDPVAEGGSKEEV